MNRTTIRTHRRAGAAARSLTVLIFALVLALGGCALDPQPGGPSERYRAELRRTDFGVVHVTAADYGSLGYGEGYAAAEDHVCNIARALLDARGTVAAALGPGPDDRHLVADAAIRALGIRAQAEAAFAAQPPELRDWLTGFAAGYSRYVREEGPSPTAWCAGADWVTPATALDFTARVLVLAQTLPRLAGAMAAARPPAERQAARALAPALIARAEAAVDLGGLGSNAWAFGSERSASGRGLLLANPHYPWYGANRFWEKHLTIPGELDVYGVGLLGAPGVAIGFNDAVAWSHTVSASQRVVFYELELAPDRPTAYVHDGEVRPLEARTVAVPVRREDGRIEEVAQTLWFSQHGPLVAMGGMEWTAERAFAVRDANAANALVLAQWLAMGRARDLDAFIAAHRAYNAMPWVNTMAASADGRALYLDNSTVGDLPEAAIRRWRESLAGETRAARLHAARGWVLLDGSDSLFAFRDDNGAPIPGTVPFERRPRLERRDYIFNSNDSYWLTNPAAPLTGFSPLYGDTGTARSLRTRMNLRMLDPAGPYGYDGADGRFTRREIQAALFDNRSLAADLLREPLLAACREAPPVEHDGRQVDLTAACEALAAYDGRLDAGARGAVLFREWLARYRSPGELFAEPFSADDPVETPRGLGDRRRALEHLAAAAAVLGEAGLALDVPLGALQQAWRGGEAIAVHGGNASEGVANLQVSGIPGHPAAGVAPRPVPGSRLLTTAGYPVVHGSSFILTVEFTDDGPLGEALLSYGQSGDPGSPHFRDQTELYRDKRWRPVHFSPDAVATHTRSRRELVGPRVAAPASP